MIVKPLISIGLPVYNGGRHLRRALDSIIEQDYNNLEIIISDNASTDDTWEVCQEYLEKDARIVLSRNEYNKGANYNFLKVMHAATGELFMWAAHDDLYDPTYIGECYQKLVENPSAIMCCSELVFINENGQVRNDWKYSNIESLGMNVVDRVHEVIKRTGWFAIYGLFRKAALPILSCFKETYGNDVVMLTKLAIAGECAKVHKPLYIRFEPDVSKSSQEHMKNITGKLDNNLNPEKPYTFLVIEMFRAVMSSEIGVEVKNNIKSDFIKTLSFENLDLRNRILREHEGVELIKYSSSKLQLFFSDILEDVCQEYSLERGGYVMGRNALIFFPHNPVPARTGAHRRCLSFIESLNELGYNITLVSSTLFTDSAWNELSVALLKKQYNVNVELHLATTIDLEYYKNTAADSNKIVAWDSYNPPSLVKYFRDIYLALRAEIVVVNYALWGKLADSEIFSKAVTIIDTHDLVSLSMKNSSVLNKAMSDVTLVDNIVDENFYLHYDLSADHSEYEIYDKFNIAVAISQVEAHLIKLNSKKTRAYYIPMIFESLLVNNFYDGAPVFVGGNNAFNVQGYMFMTAKVMPSIRHSIPDFTIAIAGDMCNHLKAEDGIELLGYINDVKDIYEHAPFAICPLIGGTGQQIKIVEAMAHGVPVIALKNVAASSPLRHGLNGFIANNAAEFSHYMELLYGDRVLCKIMGAAAKETIVQENGPAIISGKLKGAIDGARLMKMD